MMLYFVGIVAWLVLTNLTEAYPYLVVRVIFLIDCKLILIYIYIYFIESNKQAKPKNIESIQRTTPNYKLQRATPNYKLEDRIVYKARMLRALGLNGILLLSPRFESLDAKQSQ